MTPRAPTSRRRVARPHAAVVFVCILAAPMLLVADRWTSDGWLTDRGDDRVGLLFMVGVGLVAAVAAARQRVAVEGQAVTIRRLFRTQRLALVDVRHVARSGGRGSPAAILVQAPSGAVGPFAWDGPRHPESARPLVLVPVPDLMGSRRVAAALGVERRSHPSTVRGMVRRARDPLDEEDASRAVDELEVAAAALAHRSGTSVGAARRVDGGTIWLGLAAPEESLFVPVHRRTMYRREWVQIEEVSIAARTLAAELGREDVRAMGG